MGATVKTTLKAILRTILGGGASQEATKRTMIKTTLRATLTISVWALKITTARVTLTGALGSTQQE